MRIHHKHPDVRWLPNGRWILSVREAGRITHWGGYTSASGEHLADGVCASWPVAHRKQGRGLGARKRRMREARAQRAACTRQQQGWR
jgi:hypothetical protein